MQAMAKRQISGDCALSAANVFARAELSGLQTLTFISATLLRLTGP